MNATMRQRVWAMHDAGKHNAEIAQTLNLSRKMLSHYLERRETTLTKARRLFVAALIRGESVKGAASDAGVCGKTAYGWAQEAGFDRMYVTRDERAEVLARRKDAERAAMLPEIPCCVCSGNETYVADGGRLVKVNGEPSEPEPRRGQTGHGFKFGDYAPHGEITRRKQEDAK